MTTTQAAALAAITRAGIDGLTATDVGRIVEREAGLYGLTTNQLSGRGRRIADTLVAQGMIYSAVCRGKKLYRV